MPAYTCAKQQLSYPQGLSRNVVGTVLAHTGKVSTAYSFYLHTPLQYYGNMSNK